MRAVVGVRCQFFFVAYFLDQARKRRAGDLLDVQFLKLAGRHPWFRRLRLIHLSQFSHLHCFKKDSPLLPVFPIIVIIEHISKIIS